MDAELAELYLPILRADMTLCETYKFAPEAPMEAPITVFAGLADRRLRREQLERWQIHTRNFFEVQTFPGDHFFWRDNAAPMLKVIERQLLNFSRPAVAGS